MVSQAASLDDPAARASLEKLCERYWPMVYAFARPLTPDAESALDLTQGFFVHLLSPSFLASANRNVGKFRNFLLTALKHYARDEWAKTQRQKRGHGVEFVPFDTAHAEQRCAANRATDPEAAFEAQREHELLVAAKARVKERMTKRNRLDRYEALEQLLTEDPSRGAYDQLSQTLGLTPEGTRTTVHRMRAMLEQELRKLAAEETANSPFDG